MANNYIPAKLADLDAWAANFDAQCSASGLGFGLTAPQQAAIGAAAAAFHSSYVNCSTPATRTPVEVALQATNKAAFVSLAQQLAMILQASPLMTDMDRATYGITVPKSTRTPVPVPTAIPDLSINSISSGHITLRAKTLGQVGNAKPAGSIACRVYRSSGATAPTTITGMTYLGDMTARFFDDELTGVAPGTQVWYAAVFATRTNKVGPMSSVITCNVSA